MPSGILGRANLALATNTTLYTVPANKLATVSINICNRASTSASVRIAISTTGTPADTDWIIYDSVIQGNGSLERTGLVLDAAELVVVYSSSTGVTAMAYGYEE
jgi:hypothetical protein